MKVYQQQNETVNLDDEMSVFARPYLSEASTNRPVVNMNETFSSPEEYNEMNTTVVMQSHNGNGKSKSAKRVTRNLSYVIRRGSESPQSNDEAMNHADDNEAGGLNSTYTQPADEDYLSSPSDSNNSLNTSSMEALQSRARDQERSKFSFYNSTLHGDRGDGHGHGFITVQEHDLLCT